MTGERTTVLKGLSSANGGGEGAAGSGRNGIRRFVCSGRLAARFGLLGALAMVLTLPYAVPAIWDVVQMKLGLERTPYLIKPVENQLFFVQLGIILVAVPYLLWRTWAPPRRLYAGSLTLIACVFVGIQIASSTQASSLGYTLRALVFPVCLLCLFLLAHSMDLTRAGIQKIVLVAVIGFIPLGIYALAQSRGYEFLPYSKYVSESTFEEVKGKQVMSSTFGHPNYMGSYIAPLLFWALYWVLTPAKRIIKIVAACAAAIILASLILGGTRGAWLAVAVATVPYYLLLTFSPVYRRQLLFAGGVGVFLVGIILFLPLPFLRIQFDLGQRIMASQEITSRLYYWMIALETFRDHWLQGIGYANYNVVFWDAVEAFQQRESSDFFRFILIDNTRGVAPGFVHNDYLQIAVEGGIGAILVWLGLWSAFISQAWETARRAGKDHAGLLLAASFLASFVAFAVDGIFNFPMQIPVSGMLFWLTLALWVVFRDKMARAYAASLSLTPRSIPRIKLPAGPR